MIGDRREEVKDTVEARVFRHCPPNNAVWCAAFTPFHRAFAPARETTLRFLRSLVMCLTNSWCFVAPKWAGARRDEGAYPQRSVTEEQRSPRPFFGATLRAAVLFASRGVAPSLQTADGYARRSRLAGGQNPLRQNTSYL